jgi:uncharacterized protein YndB with AHSA1/START domain
MADDTYTVERSATIAAPPHRVYEQVADFHNWTNWSPWEDVDPQLQRSYSGADAGTGAVYEWSGNRQAGVGRMEITNAEDPSDVEITLDFLKPFKAHNQVTFAIRPQGEGSQVTWSMIGRKSLALKIFGIFRSMDSLVGKDFEKGHGRLNAHAQAAS